MRRLVVVPTKTSAAVAVLCLGAICAAAEARQAIIRRQRQEIARIETDVQISARQTQEPALVENSFRDVPRATPNPPSGPEKPGAKPAGIHTRRIVISIPRRRLALVEDGRVIKVYPIAVGAHGTPSPDGDFVIINHAKDPTYRHKGKVIDPGKDNPLGSRWMGLSLKGYGIHGTNIPKSIGKAASHGCFRMARKDVEDLYERVQVGDAVSVRREKDELIASVFPSDPTDGDSANTQQIAEAQAAPINSSTDIAEQH